VLHQQLGDDWKDVLKAPFPKAVNKALDKKLAQNKNPGTYVQLRCTKNEVAPMPNNPEMEEYTEEIEEWIEIVPDAPAQPVIVDCLLSSSWPPRNRRDHRNQWTETEYESKIKALENALKQSRLTEERLQREIAMLNAGGGRLNLSEYRQWNGDNVANWLCSLSTNMEFGKYRKRLQKVFREEGVRGSSLNEIGKTDLKDWGIRSFDDRVVMDKEIKRLVAMFGGPCVSAQNKTNCPFA